MSLNDLERRNSPYFAFFSSNWLASTLLIRLGPKVRVTSSAICSLNLISELRRCRYRILFFDIISVGFNLPIKIILRLSPTYKSATALLTFLYSQAVLPTGGALHCSTVETSAQQPQPAPLSDATKRRVVVD